MLVLLILLTVAGVATSFYGFLKGKTSLTYLSIAFLICVYTLGWQYSANVTVARTDVQRIYDYQFQKTDDYHVVLYIPEEHNAYIRDEAEFYEHISACDKPLLVRKRSYNIYNDLVGEELDLTPLTPTVYVISDTTNTTSADTMKIVSEVKKNISAYSKPRVNKLTKPKYNKDVIKPLKPILVELTPSLARHIVYPYVIIDNTVRKHCRIVAHGKVKRFLHNTLNQFVLLSDKGELYAVQTTKNEYLAGRIKPTYDISHVLNFTYLVSVSPEIIKDIENTVE